MQDLQHHISKSDNGLLEHEELGAFLVSAMQVTDPMTEEYANLSFLQAHYRQRAQQHARQIMALAWA